jgi:uncharacterized membrane protein YgcG
MRTAAETDARPAVLRAGRAKQGGSYATLTVGTKNGPVTFRTIVPPEEVAKIRDAIRAFVADGASPEMAKKAAVSGIGADPDRLLVPDFTKKTRPAKPGPDDVLAPDFSRRTKKQKFSLFKFSDPDATLTPAWTSSVARPKKAPVVRGDLEKHVNDAVVGMALSGLRKSIPPSLAGTMARAARSAISGSFDRSTHFVDDESRDETIADLSKWGARHPQDGFERAGYVMDKSNAGVRTNEGSPGAGIVDAEPDDEDLDFLDDYDEEQEKKAAEAKAAKEAGATTPAAPKTSAGSWGRYSIVGKDPPNYNEKRLLVGRSWKKLYRRYLRLIARAQEREIFDPKVQKKAHQLATRDFEKAGLPLSNLKFSKDGSVKLSGEEAPAAAPEGEAPVKEPEDIYEDMPAEDLIEVDPRDVGDIYNVDAWLDDKDVEDKNVAKMVANEEEVDEQEEPWLMETIMGGLDKRWKYPLSWFKGRIGRVLRLRDIKGIIRVLTEEGIAEAGTTSLRDLPPKVSEGGGGGGAPSGGGGGSPSGGGGGGSPGGGEEEGGAEEGGGAEAEEDEEAEAAEATPAAAAVQGIVAGILK